MSGWGRGGEWCLCLNVGEREEREERRNESRSHLARGPYVST